MGLFKKKKSEFVDLRSSSGVSTVKRNIRANSFNSSSRNIDSGYADFSSMKTSDSESGSANSYDSSDPQESSSGMFGIFGGVDVSSTVNNSSLDSSESYGSSDDAEERKRKLSKRILDMTNRLEEISNQLYHLQQRVEVIERKIDSNRGY